MSIALQACDAAAQLLLVLEDAEVRVGAPRQPLPVNDRPGGQVFAAPVPADSGITPALLLTAGQFANQLVFNLVWHGQGHAEGTPLADMLATARRFLRNVLAVDERHPFAPVRARRPAAAVMASAHGAAAAGNCTAGLLADPGAVADPV
jgi:hypothetical protein